MPLWTSLFAGGCSFNLPARSVCSTGTDVCPSGDLGTAPDLAPNYNDPSLAGAYKVATTPLTMSPQLMLQNGILYLPSDDGSTLSSKQTMYPLVLLAPAQRLSDPAQLAPYAQRLASHGIVVVLYQPNDETNQITYRMTGQSLLTELLANMEPAVASHLDSTHVGLAGYDLGAEMSVAIAAQSSTLSGLFLIDPKIVGASGMAVQIDGLQEMTKVKLVNGQTVLILGEDLSKNGMSGAPPCTSPQQNYEQFFANSTTTTVEIAFPNAAHGDFVSVYPDAVACGGGTMSTTDTQNLAVKYMSAYFQWTLLGQTAAMDYLSGQNFTADAQKYSLMRHSK